MRSGFTIIRNGESLGYPWKESILSMAPYVDELVVALGDCQDSTPQELQRLLTVLGDKLRIVDSPWNPDNQKLGLELSRQTNVALNACRGEVCVYLQGDEVFHDEDREVFLRDLELFENDSKAEAMVLQWVHFFGSFDYFVQSRKWYRREIRVIKKSKNLLSYGDAQGFRKFLGDGRWKKPLAKLSKARVLHYGWVRPPEVMAKKSEALDRLWHGTHRDGTHHSENVYPVQFGIQKFQGHHPLVMQERIKSFPLWDPFIGKKISKWFPLKSSLNACVEKLFGWRIGEFKNYKIIGRYP